MDMKRPVIKYITGLVTILSGIVACTPDNQMVNNPDLVFPNSYRLNIPTYYYYKDSTYFDSVNSVFVSTVVDSFYVSGDSGYTSTGVDTLSNNPLFLWDTFSNCCRHQWTQRAFRQYRRIAHLDQ